MNNAPHISPDVFRKMVVFTIQQLVQTPSVRKVMFDQLPMLVDAMGQPLPASAGLEPITQEYSKDDMEHPKAIKFEERPVSVAFRMEGTFVDDWIPAPGMLHVYLCRLRSEKGMDPHMPIQMIWSKYNRVTNEYHAISQGPILAEPAPVPKGALIKPN